MRALFGTGAGFGMTSDRFISFTVENLHSELIVIYGVNEKLTSSGAFPP